MKLKNYFLGKSVQKGNTYIFLTNKVHFCCGLMYFYFLNERARTVPLSVNKEELEPRKAKHGRGLKNCTVFLARH